MPYTVTELRLCAEREVRLRRRVYPNRVETGRMKQHAADREIAKMEAIAEHLRELEALEPPEQPALPFPRFPEA